METVTSLEEWFYKSLEGLEASPDARAYVVSVLSSMKRSENDLSKKSIVLSYAEAREKGSFESYQRIGDYVLWGMIFVPESFEVPKVAIDLGRMSYYSCWRLTRRTWTVYEELADNLPRITNGTACSMGRTF